MKAASDIYAPVKGTVVEANKALEADAGMINRQPYGPGWIFLLKIENPDDLKNLKGAAAYEPQIACNANWLQTPPISEPWSETNRPRATVM